MVSMQSFLYWQECKSRRQGSSANRAAVFLVSVSFYTLLLAFSFNISLPASPMLFVEGCVLSIEFSREIKHSILIQYQLVVLGAGIVIMNAMTCRVFCILRLSSIDESNFLSDRKSVV